MSSSRAGSSLKIFSLARLVTFSLQLENLEPNLTFALPLITISAGARMFNLDKLVCRFWVPNLYYLGYWIDQNLNKLPLNTFMFDHQTLCQHWQHLLIHNFSIFLWGAIHILRKHIFGHFWPPSPKLLNFQRGF